MRDARPPHRPQPRRTEDRGSRIEDGRAAMLDPRSSIFYLLSSYCPMVVRHSPSLHHYVINVVLSCIRISIARRMTMRLVTYRDESGVQVGALRDDQVVVALD